MLRFVVGVATAQTAVACCACTDTAGPMALRTGTIERTLAIDSIPYLAGVHLAALPGLDYNHPPVAMNDWGEVVGTYNVGIPNVFGPEYAYKWQATRGLTILSTPDVQSVATGVNDSGQVAITVFTDTSSSAAIWGWFGGVKVLRDLSTYRTPSAHPMCQGGPINNHGIVAGRCTILGAVDQPCGAAQWFPTLWTTFGTPDAFHPGGGPAFRDANVPGWTDAGFAAGTFFGNACGSSDHPHAYVYNAITHEERMLPDLVIGGVAVSTFANAVNNNGYVVGSAITLQPNCDDHAVVWLADGVARDLGICGIATGISDDGIVIGTYENRLPGDSAFAFVWTPTTGVLRLPHLYPAHGASPGAPFPNETSGAIAINRKHQILGSVTANGFNTEPPTSIAVMWTLPAGFPAGAAALSRRAP